MRIVTARRRIKNFLKTDATLQLADVFFFNFFPVFHTYFNLPAKPTKVHVKDNFGVISKIFC